MEIEESENPEKYKPYTRQMGKNAKEVTLMKNLLGFWWARGDSNPGPPPRKGGVMTSLDHGPAQTIKVEAQI